MSQPERHTFCPADAEKLERRGERFASGCFQPARRLHPEAEAEASRI